MNLSMTAGLAAAYKSGAQQTRVVTEAWGENNLYCPNCDSHNLNRLRNNTKASDYSCPSCGFWYQLKGQRTPIGKSVSDGAYAAMMEAIHNDATPNFYFLHYDLASWRIRNLLLVPSFAFPPSAIIKRKPLSPTARRAGWIGCNIALHQIPTDARIALVKESQVTPAAEVRSQFRKVKPLADIKAKERGWTLDVLNVVATLCERQALRGTTSGGHRPPLQSSGREFTTTDVYAFAPELKALHPDNRHVKDKIRQQLQVLRDMKLLIHVERGVWCLP